MWTCHDSVFVYLSLANLKPSLLSKCHGVTVEDFHSRSWLLTWPLALLYRDVVRHLNRGIPLHMLSSRVFSFPSSAVVSWVPVGIFFTRKRGKGFGEYSTFEDLVPTSASVASLTPTYLSM